MAETAAYRRKLPPIQDLDVEIHMALPSAAALGVDLGILHAHLTPAASCAEEDEEWDITWQLGQIASEMAKERDEKEKRGVERATSPDVAASQPAPLRKRG